MTCHTTLLAKRDALRHHRYIFEEKEGRDPNAPKDKDGTAKKKKSVIARLQVGQLIRCACASCWAQKVQQWHTDSVLAHAGYRPQLHCASYSTDPQEVPLKCIKLFAPPVVHRYSTASRLP